MKKRKSHKNFSHNKRYKKDIKKGGMENEKYKKSLTT